MKGMTGYDQKISSNISKNNLTQVKLTFFIFQNYSDYNQTTFLVSCMHLSAQCILKIPLLSGTKKIAHFIVSFITGLCGTFHGERKLSLRDLLLPCLKGSRQ